MNRVYQLKAGDGAIVRREIMGEHEAESRNKVLWRFDGGKFWGWKWEVDEVNDRVALGSSHWVHRR